jgi:hypothetical protein
LKVEQVLFTASNSQFVLLQCAMQAVLAQPFTIEQQHQRLINSGDIVVMVQSLPKSLLAFSQPGIILVLPS